MGYDNVFSYKIKISCQKSDYKMFSNTLKIYQKTVSFLIDVVIDHFDDIADLSMNYAQSYIEHLVHATKLNQPVYDDFDRLFPQFPSYFRRDAIIRAIGSVKSYHTLKEQYEERRYDAISNGKCFREKAPTLNRVPNVMPTFYKNGMYIPFDENSNEVRIKLYVDGRWQYKTFCLKSSDLKSLCNLKDKYDGVLTNPSLEFAYGRFQLRYGIKVKRVALPDNLDVKDRLIMSVDLGINSDAACCIMKGDGTIVAREFINFASEKAELVRLINRKKRLQRTSGNYTCKKIITKINGVNDNLSNQIQHALIDLALKYQVHTVVFEHLDFRNGSYGMRVHYWRKKKIIKKTGNKLHAYGIRWATVNSRNTSKLAFDGSGEVDRNKDNYALCKFTTGKMYNCDLSASYNIGARYFIRAMLSGMTDQEKDALEQAISIPSAVRRTYADFLNVVSYVFA